MPSVFPVFKKVSVRYRSQYRLISDFNTLVEAIIDTKIIDLLENNLFSDDHYEFRSVLSTADVLITIIRRISEAFDDKHTPKFIALDISKTFDMMWHRSLLYTIASYGISGRVFSMKNPFLTGSSLKVDFNDQVCGDLSVNAGVQQGPHFGQTHF